MFIPLPEIMIGKYWEISGELQSRWNKLIQEATPKRTILEYLTQSNHHLAFWEIFWKYSEKGRHYHTPEHMLECLKEFDGVRYAAENPLEIDAALTGHDVIYDPKRRDNEVRSAEYMQNLLLKLRTTKKFAERTKNIILKTNHITPPENIDEMLAVDIDLSILGKETRIFDKYNKNIRKEYSSIPEEAYKERRKKFLEDFLKRKQIYYTEHFRAKYEIKARENLERLLRE
ncbi:MAG: N-methyl-D-aspartate receptor NMDAR2C subunit [archaeon]